MLVFRLLPSPSRRPFQCDLCHLRDGVIPYVRTLFTYRRKIGERSPLTPASIIGSRGCIQPNSERKMNGGDGASANGGGGGGEDVAMVVADQQPTAPGLLSAAAASNNGGGGNEEAEAVEDEEMAEQQGENGDGGTNAASSSRNSSSRYSLRKRSRQPLQSIQDNSSQQTGPNSKISRGGSKKQQPSSYQADAFGYVDTSTLTDRQFERLLAQYEEDGARKREQKKQRIERGYADDDYPYVPPPEGDRPTFDDLPKEAVQIVFECLPTVRAVFNLSYQSKYMMSFVEERVSTVV